LCYQGPGNYGAVVENHRLPTCAVAVVVPSENDVIEVGPPCVIVGVAAFE
jgi:hypothetical protein